MAEKRLRNGYTTGTCAAAAANAAAAFLLCGKSDSDYSELALPGGTVCLIPVTRYEPEQESESPAFCFFVQNETIRKKVFKIDLKNLLKMKSF